MDAFRSALTQYGDFHAMLSDTVRMTAFERAIRQKVKPGDVVVDLGAGTGILGFLAIRAGADKVFCIEKSDAIELSRAVAAKNGMTDRIVFLEANSKEVSLPVKADVIVSETLGSFGVDENTLEFTADARERFLKPGGILIPQAISLHLAPVESTPIHDKIEFWREIHGIDFTPARELFGRKLMVESIQPHDLLTEPGQFDRIDLYTETGEPRERKLLFKFKRKGAVHGIGGWFDLELTEDIHLSTAPGAPATHWKQAFFPILDRIRVIEGDLMELTMSVSPQSEASDSTVISYQYRCSQLVKERQGSGEVGRNDPCPCGSGLKHKKCCGQ
jgi:protein arginine N-methyltransferase 1